MNEFDYHAPDRIDEALAMLADNHEAKALAGGMTLIPTMKQRLAAPSDLVDLGGIRELIGICEDADRIVIGAMTTHASVAESS